jgi:large subunit ribosomal protein L32e
MVNPRKKPRFLRQGTTYLKRIEKKWRRPKGTQSKLKLKQRAKGRMPSIGYGAPKNLRGMHPSGFKEVFIMNLKDLEKINNEIEAGRISGTIGKRKRNMIIEKAKELQIKILNP